MNVLGWYRDRAAKRQAITTMNDFDERALKDIGLLRSEIRSVIMARRG